MDVQCLIYCNFQKLLWKNVFAYMHQPLMACRTFRTKPLSEPVMTFCQLEIKEYVSVKFYLKFDSFYSRKCIKNVVCKMATIMCRSQCVQA